MRLFLTNEELFELTGYKSAKKQIQWLLHHGYTVESNAQGRARITHQQLHHQRFKNNAELPISTSILEPSTQPNLTKLRLLISKGNVHATS